MKKWLKVLVSVMFAACLCLALAGCGSLFGNGGDDDDDGGNSKVPEETDGTFVYSGASVKAANKSLSGELVIPSEYNGAPIDTIPSGAFSGCNAVTSIVVPDSITSIGLGAFSGCSSLRSITLPFIGSQKGNSGGETSFFGYIFGKNSYQGGSKVTHEPGALSTDYYVPTTLRSVTITKESIVGKYSFRNCYMLTSIDLNDEIMQVGQNSFQYCSKLEEITLPNITIIPSYLFDGCLSLTKFTINDSVDTIGQHAFAGCSALATLNSETTGTFIVPDTVTSIGEAAFAGCISMTDLTLPFIGHQKGNSGEAAFFGYIFGSSSYQGTTKLQHEPGVLTTEFCIPSALRNVTITNETVIGNYAFRNCTMLKSITINSGASSNVGTRAFENTATPIYN